jgi:two-component system, cell cycle response regulator DivK
MMHLNKIANLEHYFTNDQFNMKPSKILVIDDSTTNIVLLEAVLTEKGYLIETAFNAREAFMRIEKQLPDLILLDLLMPKVSGFDFLEQLRRDEKTKKTPVIVISALNTDDENLHRIKSLDAVDFLRKPIDIQYLVNLVEKVLNHS